MKSLLVIGNSQVGALKEGYYSIQDNYLNANFWSIPGGGGPNIDIDASGNLLGSEHVISDCLLHNTDSLQFRDYDILLISGVGIPAIRTSNETLHRSAVPASFATGDLSSLKRSLVSQNCYAEMVRYSIALYPSFQNIHKIRNNYSGRLMVQMFPLPTKGVFSQSDSDMDVYGDHALSFLAWYYKLQNSILLEECRRLGAELIEYPSSWMDQGLTPDQFSSNDAWHMNLEFGKFFFADLVKKLI